MGYNSPEPEGWKVTDIFLKYFKAGDPVSSRVRKFADINSIKMSTIVLRYERMSANSLACPDSTGLAWKVDSLWAPQEKLLLSKYNKNVLLLLSPSLFLCSKVVPVAI